MVQIHSPRPLFPLSIQQFTLRFQLQILLRFYGQYGQHRWFGALELLAAKRVDAVILDYQMPGMTSAAALQVSKRVSPGTLVVILSGAATTAPQGARRAATTVLLKYKSMPRLMHSIEGFLEDKLQKLDSAAELTVGKQFGKVRREVPALRSGK